MVSEIERCRAWIEAALAHSGGTHEFEDIVAGVSSGHMQFWPGEKSAAITEILEYPQKRTLNVFLAGGDMQELLVMMDSAKAWAKAQNCDAMTMSGRKGWLRVLCNHKWKEAFSTMALDLKEQQS